MKIVRICPVRDIECRNPFCDKVVAGCVEKRTIKGYYQKPTIEKYRCTYKFNRTTLSFMTNEYLHLSVTGFWLDKALIHTTDPNEQQFYIPPHNILYFEKIKGD